MNMNLKLKLDNKKKLLLIGTAVLIVAAILSVQFNSPESTVQTETPVAQEPAAPAVPQFASVQEILNEQLLMAVIWQQNAAEYRALCYQAFNIALDRVKWGLVQNMSAENALPPAIVLDLDETALDNLVTDSTRIGTDIPYRGSDWTDWINSGEAKAIPGAVKFLQTVDRLGVQIFYVSNRPESWKEGTVRSMASLGFPQLEDSHLVFKTDSSDKMQRFTELQKSYNVLVYLGDDLGDMPVGSYGKDSAARNDIVDANGGSFGVSYIILPNPTYGHWESALAEGYFGLSPEEQYKIRREAVKIWRPAEAQTAPAAAN